MYQFYIDDNLVLENCILEQNQEFQLKVKVNDIELTDTEFIVGNSNSVGKKSSGMYYILPNAPISTSNPCKISVIDVKSRSLKSVSITIIPHFTLELDTYSTTAAVANKIKWTFTSTCSKYNIAFQLELLYNDGVVRIVNISGAGTGTVNIPINNNPDINFAVARTRITHITFTQYWSSQGFDEQYSVKFYNAYYSGSSNLVEYPFYMEPVELNMLFARGNGTGRDPYEIQNALQLKNMQYMVEQGRDDYASENWIMGNYVLTNNISTDLKALPTLRGTFRSDENVRTITINNLTSNGLYSGLFSKVILGTVENINVNVISDSSSSGTKYKGIICGYMSHGTISDCVVRGNLTNQSNNNMTSEIGGVVGRIATGVIARCNSLADIDTYGNAGGIAGVQLGGNIHGCIYSGHIKLYYTIGSVKSDNDNVALGGIVGKMSLGSIWENKFTGTISYEGEKCNDNLLKPCIGYFVGRNVSGGGSIEGSTAFITGNINSGDLQDKNGFLGIGRIKQCDYVAKDKAFWGRGN